MPPNLYTIWEFRSPSTGEARIVPKVTEPREYEHEYQRVLGRAYAYTKAEAVAAFP